MSDNIAAIVVEERAVLVRRNSAPGGAETAPPDFEQIVKTILATFAVFTGLTISNYLKEAVFTDDNLKNYHDWHAWAADWRCWAFAALVSLLLRYLIGSALHLNHTYVTKPEGAKEARSGSVILLFKDLLFLVIFGVTAVFIAKAPDIDLFINRAGWFLLGGLTWSIMDGVVRTAWRNEREKPGLFWVFWTALDLAQLVFTWFLISLWVQDKLLKAEFLAVVFLVFLFLDILVMVRAIQKGSK